MFSISRLSLVSRHITTPVLRHASKMSGDLFKKTLRTAACIIIGDEILSGKTVDSNSAYFAKYCFDLGIDLKRIEVIADDESEIIEAARRLSAKHDFVITSGGIGPTHDDITYASLATAFNSPLAMHQETRDRMKRITMARPNAPPFDWDTPSPALTARMRMATLPSGEGTKVVFVSDDLWVPIAIVNYNVHILPGIPRIFVQLLEGLKEIIIKEGRVDKSQKSIRVLISTPLVESEVAEYLTKLQERVAPRGVKIGSYPRWGMKRNTITMVGSDVEYIESLVEEVERETQGTRVTDEDMADEPGQDKTEEALKNKEAQNQGGLEAKEKKINEAVHGSRVQHNKE
ncbi:MoaB/Mog domain-containing protein [Pyronema omphalodes]|nr:MoaB/Mog domain-containing protein [Pyronema omphalodes]